MDLGPTLLALAGFKPSTAWDGENLLPRLARAEAPPDEEVSSVARYGSLISLTTADWHAIWHLDEGSVKLYDNRQDPTGLVDVAGERVATIHELERRLQPFLAERRASNARAQTHREQFRSENFLSGPEERHSSSCAHWVTCGSRMAPQLGTQLPHAGTGPGAPGQRQTPRG